MAEPTGELPKNPDSQDEVLRAAYEKAKREFSAADLQRYTVEEEGVPLEQVIRELEENQRRHDLKKRAAE